MKALLFYAWIVVAGLILGASISSKAERCGHSVQVDGEWIASSLVWPVLLVAGIVADKDSIAWSECK